MRISESPILFFVTVLVSPVLSSIGMYLQVHPPTIPQPLNLLRGGCIANFDVCQHGGTKNKNGQYSPKYAPLAPGCQWMLLDINGLSRQQNPLLERAWWTLVDLDGLVCSGADGSRTRVRPSYWLPTHSQA